MIHTILVTNLVKINQMLRKSSMLGYHQFLNKFFPNQLIFSSQSILSKCHETQQLKPITTQMITEMFCSKFILMKIKKIKSKHYSDPKAMP